MMRKVVLLLSVVIVAIALVFWPTIAHAKSSKNVLFYYDFDNCKKIAKLPQCSCSHEGISCIDGVKNRALDFLGKGDFIRIQNAATHSFTVTFWMRTVERGANDKQGNFYGCTGLVDASGVVIDESWGINLCGDRAGFGVGGTTINSLSSVTTGRWRFVAVTRNFETGDMELFINGSLEAQASGISRGVELGGAPEIYVGALHESIENLEKIHYFGSLDELKVFGRVLSADEIKSIYEQYNPYRVQVIQVTKKEQKYKEIEPEKDTFIERRPGPRPRM